MESEEEEENKMGFPPNNDLEPLRGKGQICSSCPIGSCGKGDHTLTSTRSACAFDHQLNGHPEDVDREFDLLPGVVVPSMIPVRLPDVSGVFIALGNYANLFRRGSVKILEPLIVARPVIPFPVFNLPGCFLFTTHRPGYVKG